MGFTSRAFQLVSPSVTRLSTHEVRVLSYNLLANKYAISGAHSYCPPEYLAWGTRWRKIKAEIELYNADIVCLQEVSEALQNGALASWGGANGYDAKGLYICRGYRKEDEGIALWYRSSMFTRLDSCVVRYSDCLSDFSEAPLRFLEKAAACQEGLVMALLKHNASGALILAVATHLFWDPNWPDVKLLQSHLMSQSIANFLQDTAHKGLLGLKSYKDVAVIIGGDFNSLWRDPTVPGKMSGGLSGAYQLLANGTLDSTHPHHPLNQAGHRPAHQKEAQQLAELRFHTSGLRFVSAYMQAWGYEPPVTNKTATFAGGLDYVWLSQPHSRVVEVLTMPYEHDSNTQVADVKLGAIPNAECPSDHLAICCTVQLTPETQSAR